MDYEQLPSLPMGFKFRPNQQELLLYLKHKLAGEPLGNDPIADVDVYDWEPGDLPGTSKLKKEVRKWYFYTRLQKKSEKKSLRTNRETNKGQWRPTGNDRKVCYNSRTLRFSGTKKILSFYSREDGRCVRTKWGMHQYSLGDKESHGNSLVLCEIFLKPYDESTGGEAPSGEASREHDDVAAVAPAPGETAPTGVVVDDGGYVEAANLSQDVNHSGLFIEDYQLPIGGTSETSELHPDPKFVHIPEQHGMDAEPWTNGFIEAHDLAIPMEADSACLGPADNPDLYFHPSELLGLEDSRPHDSQMDVNHSGVFVEDYQLPIGGTSKTSALYPDPKFAGIQEQHGMDAEPWTDGFIEAHDLVIPMEADSACLGPADNPDLYLYLKELLGVEDSGPHDSQKDVNHSGVSIQDYQLPIVGTSKRSVLCPDPKFADILEQHGMDAEPSTAGFTEAHDLVIPMEADSACLGPADNPDFYLYSSELLRLEDSGPHDSQKDVDSWVLVEDCQQPVVGTSQAPELHPDQKNVHNQEQYVIVAEPLKGTENSRSSVTLKNEIVGADQVLDENLSASFDTNQFLNLDDYPEMGLFLSEISGTENTRPPVPRQNEIAGANQVLEAKMDRSGGKRHKHA